MECHAIGVVRSATGLEELVYEDHGAADAVVSLPALAGVAWDPATD
jgi:hypothetical protein